MLLGCCIFRLRRYIHPSSLDPCTRPYFNCIPLFHGHTCLYYNLNLHRVAVVFEERAQPHCFALHLVHAPRPPVRVRVDAKRFVRQIRARLHARGRGAERHLVRLERRVDVVIARAGEAVASELAREEVEVQVRDGLARGFAVLQGSGPCI
jgi:hypothetical protein